VPADERRGRFRCGEGALAKSGSENLVEQDLSLVLLDALSESELGDQDLPSLGKHALLTGGKPTLTFAAPEVANNLGHLQHIAGVKLLEIGLIPTRPIGRLLGMRRTKNAEDSFQTVSVNNIPDPYKVQVACRYANDKIGLTNNSQYQIELVLTLDLAGFDVLDDGGSVIGVDHRFSDCKGHIVLNPFRATKFSTAIRLPWQRLR